MAGMENMMITKSTPMTKFINVLFHIILYACAFCTLLPVIFSICGGFKGNQELLTSSNLLPKVYTAENYKYAWETVNFAKYTLNSVFITACAVLGALITSTMSAYVLSRKEFPGKKLIKSMYIWSMFISLGAATLYPVFQMIVGLKLNNSHMGIIILQIGAQVANILLIEGYLSGISKEYDEAAKLDGCGFFNTYVRIILPLIAPVIAIVALLTFKGSWNDYLMPMVLTMGKTELQPLTVAIVGMKSSGMMATSWSVILAGATISIVPIVVIYCFTNKFFIAGLTLGGVKG